MCILLLNVQLPSARTADRSQFKFRRSGSAILGGVPMGPVNPDEAILQLTYCSRHTAGGGIARGVCEWSTVGPYRSDVIMQRYCGSVAQHD